MKRNFIDIRITALSEVEIKDILIALRKIQICGDVGMSRTLPLYIDGDGSGQFDFEVHENEITKPKLNNIRDIVFLNEGDIEEVMNGEDFNVVGLGE